MDVKLGLIGLGDHMYQRIYPLLAKYPLKLIAVCDKDEERITRFTNFYATCKTYTDYHDMIKNESMDALICVGDAKLHYEVSKECMLHGISPFVEKSPCLSFEQAEELLEIQKQTGCFTMIGFNRRFTTSYVMAKEIIEREEFGKPLMYLAKYNSSAYSSEDYFVFNHLLHHLDLARFLMGEIEEIHGDMIRISEKKVGYHISFITQGGALGFIQSGSTQQEPYPMERVEISGDERNVIIDNVKHLEYNRPSENKMKSNPSLKDVGDALCWNYNLGHSSLYGHYGFEKELECYYEAIINKTLPSSTYCDVAGTMKLYEMLKKNINVRQII